MDGKTLGERLKGLIELKGLKGLRGDSKTFGTWLVRLLGVAVVIWAVSTLHLGHWALLAGVIVSIFAHELGHWFFARLFGVPVAVFSIGFFEPSLKLFSFWGTEFRVTPWFVLGGYVQIDPDDEQFRRHAIWQRVIVLTAGVAMNGLVALLCLTSAYMVVGKPIGSISVTQLAGPQSPAAKAGIEVGDTIVSIDNRPVHTGEDVISSFVMEHSNDSRAQLVLKRAEKLKYVEVTPASGRIGVSFEENRQFQKVGYEEAIVLSGRAVQKMVTDTGQALGMYLGLRAHPANLHLRGMIAVVQVGGAAFDQGLFTFMRLLAAVNVSLMVMNLLPLPVLDGGHLFNIGYEAVTRRRATERTRRLLARISLILMFAVMALTVYNDLIFPIFGHASLSR